ncbi:MAG: LysM peptidoglycan-binding domain-containing protein [Dysgonamonadaceae bacterium]|jgi:LysM repeat protein|nr:LysM peptidoglycan-binding domain-containing protein [Dysgonamonadaceae bacterium]
MLPRYLIFLLFACLQFYNVNSANAFCSQATFFSEKDDYFLHTVENGQTVFSIASKYRVQIADIYKLNPNSETRIKVGERLKIPKNTAVERAEHSEPFVNHQIQPKETLYALSRKYGVKREDILAANPGLSIETFYIGKVVRIPTTQTDTLTLDQPQLSAQSLEAVRIAVLLPFGLKDDKTDKNVVDRMVEYYEGFLLALKTLKSKGISVDLQVYDIGSDEKEISNVLKKKEMQDVQLIIGGLSDEQIKIISGFSNDKNIPYVIPFTSMSSEISGNPKSYQVNTPQSVLHQKASNFFIDKYKKYRIILLSGTNGSSNQSEFIDLLRSDMQKKKISFTTVHVNRLSDADFISELNVRKNNVLIPDDDSPETVEKIISSLRTIQKKHSEYKISLFGYPRWQTFGSKYAGSFSPLNTSFFSVFYANMNDQEVKNFYSTFFKWYGRTISDNFPKFGILGYDTGMYFIQTVHTYGTNFETKINSIKYKGLQTDFHFERINDGGGFVNTNLFSVSYNPDRSITQTNVK